MEDTKKCPYCAEEVRAEAIKCKHCGSTIEADTNTIETPRPTVVDNGILLVIMGVLFIGLAVYAFVNSSFLGIFAAIFGIVLMAAGFNPTARVDCPKCDGRVVVGRDTARVKCRSCKSEYDVKWTERPKVELPY